MIEHAAGAGAYWPPTVYITFDQGSAQARRAEVGRIIVRFDRERALAELVQQHRANRRRWVARLPSETWASLAATLERSGFPTVGTCSSGAMPAQITADVRGRVERVVFDATSAEYGEIHRLAWSVVAQMAPDVVRGRPATWIVPGSNVEDARELTNSSAVTELEQRMTVETCVIDEFACWFNGDEAFCDPEVLEADFQRISWTDDDEQFTWFCRLVDFFIAELWPD